MKGIFYIFTGLITLATITTYGVPFSNYRFHALVGSKYQSAIKCYNDILDWLLIQLQDYDPEATIPKRINDNVLKSISDLTVHLNVASKNALTISKELEGEMERQTAQISALQGKIQQQDATIKGNQVVVQRKQNDVTLAAQRLQTAQANLQTHNAALSRAKKRKRKAERDCIRRRRFKRGLFKKLRKAVKRVIKRPVKIVRKIVDKTVRIPKKIIKGTVKVAGKVLNVPKKIIKGTVKAAGKVVKGAAKGVGKLGKGTVNVLKKAICKTLNVLTRNIDKAKKDVKKARGVVAQSQQSLSVATAEKSAAVRQLEAAKAERIRLQKEKNVLLNALTMAKQRRNKLIDISAKAKRTVRQVNDLKDPAVVLRFNTELRYLLDIKNVVVPLREIGSKVSTIDSKTGKASFLPKLSNKQISDMKAKLIAIDEKGALSAEQTEDHDSKEGTDTSKVDDTWDELFDIKSEERDGGEEALSDIFDENVAMNGNSDSSKAAPVKAPGTNAKVPLNTFVRKASKPLGGPVVNTAKKAVKEIKPEPKATDGPISEADIDDDILDTNIDY